MSKYTLEYLQTFSNLSDFTPHISKFNHADLVITNNIKTYSGMNYSDICSYVKKSAKVIKIEFFRFAGFWPIEFEAQNNEKW